MNSGSLRDPALPARRRRIGAFLRDNGLTLALLAATAATLGLMLVAGWVVDAQDRTLHGKAMIRLADYARSGAFLSALFENWESEFLQMATYVCLTAVLFQRGSAESRDPDSQGDAGPSPLVATARTPLRRLAAWLYSYSLGLALAALFVLAFAAHLYGGFRLAGADALRHAQPPPSFAEFAVSARFWFDSLQNWQSEFLSTAVLVVLSIWLRFHGSPESKPVEAPDSQTAE